MTLKMFTANVRNMLNPIRVILVILNQYIDDHLVSLTFVTEPEHAKNLQETNLG